MHHLLDVIASVGTRYGMELHWNKFQLLQIGGVYNFSAPDGTIIAPAEVMTYLGATLYSDGKVKRELNRQFCIARGDYCRLSRLWNHTSLAMDRKISIYKAVVIKRLLYGLSTAWLNAAELRRLNGFHCRCLRRILRIPPSFLSRVSNLNVLKAADETPLGKQLLKSQLLLFGRVARAPDTDPLRRLVFTKGTTQLASNQYVRKVGRPRNEWAAMLQKECWKMGTGHLQAIRVEHEWKAAVMTHYGS